MRAGSRLSLIRAVLSTAVRLNGWAARWIPRSLTSMRSIPGCVSDKSGIRRIFSHSSWRRLALGGRLKRELLRADRSPSQLKGCLLYGLEVRR